MNQAFKPSPVHGTHHVALRCVDAEQTRWFYEDVIGLKLAAALPLKEFTGKGRDGIEYLHIFFELGDGKYLAFFDAPANAPEDTGARKHSFDLHIAFEVANEEELLAMKERVQSHGKTSFGPVEHGFVRSVYLYDPNGYQVEFTYRTGEHDPVMEHEADVAHAAIADWSKRTRDEKIRLFGSDWLKTSGWQG